jgi:putative tricarboxylic transport membrane protein
MTAEEVGSGATGRRAFLGPRLVAGFLLALSLLLIVSAIGIASGAGYSVIGPATIPLAVAIGLLILGIVFAARTTVVPDTDLAERAADEDRATHWPTAGTTLGLLLLYGLALDGFELGPLDVPGLGYVVATGLFLPAVAWVLGSRFPLRDLIIGFAVAGILYVGFTEYLGVRLPPGLLGLVG